MTGAEGNLLGGGYAVCALVRVNNMPSISVAYCEMWNKRHAKVCLVRCRLQVQCNSCVMENTG